MEYFGLKLGQDLGNREAHPYQKFRGVPPPPPGVQVGRVGETSFRLKTYIFATLVQNDGSDLQKFLKNAINMPKGYHNLVLLVY